MISFECKCGKHLRVKPEAAGKRVRCPACREPVRVPVPAPTPEPYRVQSEPDAAAKPAASSYCPKCHVGLQAGAVLCTTCGYDLRTGRVIERQRPLMERIPWRTLRNVAINLVLLGVLIYIGLWAVNHMRKTQEAEEQQKQAQEQAAAPRERDVRQRKGAPATAAPALIDVHVTSHTSGPAPPDTLSLEYTDATLRAAQARETLLRKVRQEAYDAFFLEGHQMAGGPATGGKTPPLKLVLDLNVDVGWAFRKSDQSVLPQAPRVLHCTAALRREGKEPLWDTAVPYEAEPKRRLPGEKDLARMARLEATAPGINFSRYSDRDAAEVARTVLHPGVVPNRLTLEKLLEKDKTAEAEAATALDALDKKSDAVRARELAKAGNSYVLTGLAKRLDTLSDLTLLAAVAEKAQNPGVADRAAVAYVSATGKLPPAKRDMKLQNPHLLLAGPLRKKFLGTEHLFADLLPFLELTRPSAPHVVLAFARTALTTEENKETQRKLEALCTAIETTRSGLGRHENQALETLGREERANELGRQALLALLQSGRSLAEQPAMDYMTRVAGGLVPDAASPWADGSLRLSDTQMAILDGIAQCDPGEASDAAVGLLLRVGGEQRQKVRGYVEYPEPTRQSSTDAIATIEKGTPDDVAALVGKLPKHPALYPVSEYLADAYYRYTQKKVAAAPRVAVLEYLTYVGRRSYIFADALVSLAGSEDAGERKAAAAALVRIAGTLPELAELLAPVIAKEADPEIKAQLEAARKRAIAARGPRAPGDR